ncbi:transporter [Rhizobium calliandrae]|uniref:Transporter n=1 Tax=Rhizobium calliandrae TaxID=1312182 RepID=A0ABT7K7P4_9HYPH|nr:transporter [Rhizobium calliandrae]MDL2404622.1 transporter [Rhizobium calliandrae]
MQSSVIRLGLDTWRARLGVGAFSLLLALPLQGARADEAGVSFWLPGQFGSLAAAPQTPGWSLGAVYFHTSVHASGGVAAARQIEIGGVPATAGVSLDTKLHSRADLLLLAPTYTFDTPVLGGQLAVSMSGIFGRNSTSIDGTLTAAVGPIVAGRTREISDAVTSFGDLYPMATLKWQDGVHNWMVYGTGDIPVGDYDSTRLSNLGLGHGAIDSGGGYTYLNQKTGREFSAVAGLTYNFKNPDTQYRSGIDFHVDWGASQFLNEHVFVGLVGYVYQQLTPDTGQHPILGSFESRVVGIGPQIGYIFPIGKSQGYLNLKGYTEFDAANRPSGWNTWLTFSISGAPTASN